jgi:hypothetical protein
MKSIIRYLLVCFVLGCAAGLSGNEAYGQARQADFTQVTRPVAQLSDPGAIDELLTELIITPQIPQDSINRVEVVDVTGNGYGPDDLVVVYPSGETFNIDPSLVTGRVQEIMRSWSLESEFQYDGANAPAETFRPDTTQVDTVDADTLEAQPRRAQPQDEEQAENEIMADVLETVQRNYQGEAVSLLLEKDANGFTFEMWDYNQQAMRYQAAPGGPPDTVQTRDLVYVVRSDSVIYDVVYINRTVEETEYIPQGPTSALPEEQRNGSQEGARPSGTATPRRP